MNLIATNFQKIDPGKKSSSGNSQNIVQNLDGLRVPIYGELIGVSSAPDGVLGDGVLQKCMF